MNFNKRLPATDKLSTSESFQAYDATLEAFSTALDLRDREAKGHTLHITEMVLSLAKALKVDKKELIHFRRGALLHHIGNLAVPECILFKQGELTVDEWVCIHLHPFYAYEILGPIVFLRQALDIPYCHHEKWDGTGYPRGLKGLQIPLAARIFAVVDVWDALTSDRPYRQAWSKEKAREYIQTEAGTHFDPQVVKTFFLEHE
jgi:HD-GYP domain-containing protein (c-di-GMP phosphodiesterase class II)